jgi:hypothetical protein
MKTCTYWQLPRLWALLGGLHGLQGCENWGMIPDSFASGFLICGVTCLLELCLKLVFVCVFAAVYCLRVRTHCMHTHTPLTIFRGMHARAHTHAHTHTHMHTHASSRGSAVLRGSLILSAHNLVSRSWGTHAVLKERKIS